VSGTYTYTLVGAWGMGWGGILRVGVAWGVGLRAWDFGFPHRESAREHFPRPPLNSIAELEKWRVSLAESRSTTLETESPRHSM
jgi:hypothetical protein